MTHFVGRECASLSISLELCDVIQVTEADGSPLPPTHCQRSDSCHSYSRRQKTKKNFHVSYFAVHQKEKKELSAPQSFCKRLLPLSWGWNKSLQKQPSRPFFFFFVYFYIITSHVCCLYRRNGR